VGTDYDIDPEAHPERLTYVLLHDGGGSLVEAAYVRAAIPVKNNQELRMVLMKLDSLEERLNRDWYWHTVQTFRREMDITPEQVEQVFLNA
jgi:hypothetical protein